MIGFEANDADWDCGFAYTRRKKKGRLRETNKEKKETLWEMQEFNQRKQSRPPCTSKRQRAES
jgi:hypothetical protein